MIVYRSLQKYPDRRSTFKQIEQKLSEALKKCQQRATGETKDV